MSAKRWDGVAQIDLTTFKRWDGAAFQDIATGQRWSGSAWVNLGLGGSAALAATVSPGSASGVVFNSDPSAPPAATVTSNSVTVTSTGGAGAGPTYQWTRISGSSSITATVPTGNVTAFTGLIYSQDTQTATFRCTVTRGVDSVTLDVQVTLRYFGGTE